jgi:hypothetical protein
MFIAFGIFGIASAHFDWPHSRFWTMLDKLDPGDTHALLDKPWVAGGRNRYYRTIGWVFLGLGLFMLFRHHFQPE